MRLRGVLAFGCAVAVAVGALGVSPAQGGVSDPPAIDAAATPTERADRIAAVPRSALPIAANLPALPSQPEGVPFPTAEAGWPTGPLPAGVNQAALDTAVERALGSRFNPATVRSLVVVHGGRLVYERYKSPSDAVVLHDSYSVAKSFTHALIGLLYGDGLIDPMAPAPVTQWSSAGDPRRAITVDHLLRMNSGLRWNEAYSGLFDNDILAMFGSQRWSDYVAAKPLEAPPGTVHRYSTGTSVLLAGLAVDTIGSPAAADRYLRDRLFTPLGIGDVDVVHDGDGRIAGGVGINMTTRDFARLGLLYLRDGVWDQQRLLPVGWVDYARSPSATEPGYGAHWWVDEQGRFFSAVGLFNQLVVVSPQLDLVIAINTNPGGNGYALRDAVYEAFSALP